MTKYPRNLGFQNDVREDQKHVVCASSHVVLVAGEVAKVAGHDSEAIV